MDAPNKCQCYRSWEIYLKYENSGRTYSEKFSLFHHFLKDNLLSS